MSIDKLKKYANSANIAHDLSEEELSKIGQKVMLGYQEDKLSNEEWLADVLRIEELASLKTHKKSTPLPNSANIKLPLITKACYEFTSRVYPEIIQDGKVVKHQIIGMDSDGVKEFRGKNVSDYMNYHLLQKNQVWEAQLDMLLMRIAIVGFICKKTYYDPIRGGIESILCDPKELFIHCDSISLEKAPRISHILHYRLNDLIERKNTKVNDESVFLEGPVKELIELHKTDDLNSIIDGIEQCTYLDLDGDGYLEPYIVTVLKENGKVLRIAPRFYEEDIKEKNGKLLYIDPIECYEDYHFLPNPNGKFQSVGFGTLLLHLNEAVNATFNMLADSGQLSNMKGGYMDARLKATNSGNSLHDPGEFKLIQVRAGSTLKDGIMPIEYGEPSSVLFQLLELLIDVSRDLTSSAQINTGTQSSENAKTGATLALQEAGTKVFNSINKRVYRSLAKEFRHRFKLHEKYADPEEYINVLDDTKIIMQEDFDSKSIDVIPVADPNLSSAIQKGQEIQSLMALAQSGLVVDPIKLTKLVLSRITIPGVQDIMPDEEKNKAPDPEIIKLQAEIENMAQERDIDGAKLDLQEKDLLIKAQLVKAQIKKMECECVALLAKAEAEDAKLQLQDYQMQLDHIGKQLDTVMQIETMAHEQELAKQEASTNETQGPGPVAEQPSNPTPPLPPEGAQGSY